MNHNILALLLLGAVCSGCSPKEQTTANTTAPIATAASSVAATIESTAPRTTEVLGTYWKLVGLNGKDVAVQNQQREPHVIFGSDRRITGSDGCNRLMGAYQINGEALSLGQMAGTRMACMEGDAQAQVFIEALSKVASYQLQGEFLDLRDATGMVIARFNAAALP